MTANEKKEHGNAPEALTAEAGRPCVYILKCADGTLYTGWTNDFPRRLKAHNSGKGAKYTRSRLPAVPVYIEYAADRSCAAKREAAIKKLTRAKKLTLISSAGNVPVKSPLA